MGSGSGPKVPLQRVWVLTLHKIFKSLVPGVETAGFKTPQPDGSAEHENIKTFLEFRKCDMMQ